jgi:hypothetical protein
VEFGGPRTAPISLTEHRMKTLAELLPTLCEAVCLGERYTCQDGVFRLQCTGTHCVARMYQDTRIVTFKIVDLRYLMNMLHLLQGLQYRYIHARDDIMAYAAAALGSIELLNLNLLVPYSYRTISCLSNSNIAHIKPLLCTHIYF